MYMFTLWCMYTRMCTRRLCCSMIVVLYEVARMYGMACCMVFYVLYVVACLYGVVVWYLR